MKTTFTITKDQRDLIEFISYREKINVATMLSTFFNTEAESLMDYKKEEIQTCVNYGDFNVQIDIEDDIHKKIKLYSVENNLKMKNVFFYITKKFIEKFDV